MLEARQIYLVVLTFPNSEDRYVTSATDPALAVWRWQLFLHFRTVWGNRDRRERPHYPGRDASPREIVKSQHYTL